MNEFFTIYLYFALGTFLWFTVMPMCVEKKHIPLFLIFIFFASLIWPYTWTSLFLHFRRERRSK